MPVHILAQGAFEGLGSIPFFWPILKSLPVLAALYGTKSYFGGAVNSSERNMHSKVVMITVCFHNPGSVPAAVLVENDSSQPPPHHPHAQPSNANALHREERQE